MESLESILADIQGKYKDPDASNQHTDEQTTTHLPKQTKPIAPVNASSLDSLLNELRSNSFNNSQSNSSTYPTVTSTNASPVIDRDLQQVEKQQKVKDQQAIAKTATEWLNKLDPLGGEGLWFEEFAKNYPSRLEAAIALLQSQ